MTEADIGTSCSPTKGCIDTNQELCIDGRLLGGPNRHTYYGPCLCWCHEKEEEDANGS